MLGDLAETPVTQFKEPTTTFTAYTSEARGFCGKVIQILLIMLTKLQV